MTLFNDVKKFVSKIVDNPVKVGIIAFLVWKIIKKETSKESLLVENIRVISRKGSKELVFDDKRNAWAVIDGSEIKFFSTEQRARKNFEGVRIGKGGVSERVSKIHESFSEDHVEKGIFPLDEFLKGLVIEKKEHSGLNPLSIAQLVLDHLKENEYYYSKQNSEKESFIMKEALTSKDDGHRHEWSPGQEFTSVNEGHKHEIEEVSRMALESDGHSHKLLTTTDSDSNLSERINRLKEAFKSPKVGDEVRVGSKKGFVTGVRGNLVSVEFENGEEKIIPLVDLESFSEQEGEKTPGFDMSECIQKMGSQAENPEALCQFIYQDWKKGNRENPFPENLKNKNESFKEKNLDEEQRQKLAKSMYKKSWEELDDRQKQTIIKLIKMIPYK